MGGLAYRRDTVARRALRGHLDAGERFARLAHRRQEKHAHDRLSGKDTFAVVVRRRRLARDIGRRGLHRLAVPVEGRSDGPRATRMWCPTEPCLARRLPSPIARHRHRLRGRLGHAVPIDRRRRNSRAFDRAGREHRHLGPRMER